MLTARINLLLFVICAVLAVDAFAHTKTDVVTLYNGDRITGEIKSLQGGLISLGTNAMGTLLIEWKEVATVLSSFNYEVRLATGSRLFGTLAPGDSPGEISIAEVSGVQTLDWDAIVELRPIENTVLDRLDIYASASLGYNRASDIATSELKLEVSYENENALNQVTSRSTVTRTEEETISSSRVTLSRQRWTDRSNLFRIVSGGFEQNDELGLDYRYTVGYGLGRYFLDTQNSSLSGSISLRALREGNNSGKTTDSAEADFTFDYGVWRFDNPDLDLRYGLSLYPSLTEQGRLRGDTDLRLRWELYKDLFWDISAWGTYDNQTVDSDAERAFDWGLTTGVGWEF